MRQLGDTLPTDFVYKLPVTSLSVPFFALLSSAAVPLICIWQLFLHVVVTYWCKQVIDISFVASLCCFQEHLNRLTHPCNTTLVNLSEYIENYTEVALKEGIREGAGS